MPVTYQVEPWETYVADVQPLWLSHWLSVGLDHAQVPLAPDYARYQALAAAGILHVLTMRTVPDAKLVGYHVSLVQPHLHYVTTLTASVDLYYVDPAYRKGLAGVRLFREAERYLKACGVVRIHSGCKVHHGLDMTRLFERLGYTLTDKLFSKLL